MKRHLSNGLGAITLLTSLSAAGVLAYANGRGDIRFREIMEVTSYQPEFMRHHFRKRENFV